MNFQTFADANLARCEAPNGFNHKLSDWNSSDWMVALLGEAGEACNVVKKLNRYRDGIRGNKDSEAELRDKFKRELGDIGVYLDLVCQAHGWTMEECMLLVFNSKSRELGYPELSD